nr:hypothetical protein [Tanacetum cinerariifolium]
MELAVEQHCVEKTKFQTEMGSVLQENDRLLKQALSVEIVNIVVHEYMKFDCLNVNACVHCRDTVSSSKSAPTFAELFEINELKVQVQEKDTVILKLKEKIKSFSGDDKERKAKREIEEIETQNLELDHKVTKLADENEHLKQTYKQLFDSIKSLRVQSKEHCDDLIKKVNLKSVEVSDLNVDVAPLVPKLRKNRTAHNYACKYTRWIQELLMILQQTCPSVTDLGTKLVAVTPKNKPKQIRRIAQITKSERTTVATSPLVNIDSNTPVLSSTGVTLVSSASGSKSQDNTKKNRIRRIQKKAKETKLEDHLRNVKSSLNKASAVDSKATSSVIKSVSNVNSNLKCASCNGCLFSDNHDACVVEYINSVNARKKSKSVNTPVKRKEKVLVITALKEQLSKLKGKAVLTKAVSLKPIDPALLQVDVASLVPKLHKNMTTHSDYIRHTQEEAATLREIVESERLLSPLNKSLAYACKYTGRIQELLMILQQTYPSITDLGTKLVPVTPMNKTK